MHNGTVIKFISLKTGKSRDLWASKLPAGDDVCDATLRRVCWINLLFNYLYNILKIREENCIARGIGIIAGNDDLSVLAWSDAGPTPNIYIYQYLLPSRIIHIKGPVTQINKILLFGFFYFLLSPATLLSLVLSNFLLPLCICTPFTQKLKHKSIWSEAHWSHFWPYINAQGNGTVRDDWGNKGYRKPSGRNSLAI